MLLLYQQFKHNLKDQNDYLLNRFSLYASFLLEF